MRLTPALAFLVALAAAPAAAGAQRARPEFNLAAGPTFPVGNPADDSQTGYNVIAGVGFTPRASALGIRIEGLYSASTLRNHIVVCSPGSGCGHQSWVSGLTVDFTYSRPLALRARSRREPSRVYLIGGLGLYTVHVALDSVLTPAGTIGYSLRNHADAGWNLGGGIRVPLGSVSAYVEARVHTMTDTGERIVPLSVGLIF